MLQINLVTKEVTRTPLPQSLKGLLQESLEDLSWADAEVGVENLGFWTEIAEGPSPDPIQKYSGNETYRIDEENKCIYVTKEIISQSTDEISMFEFEQRMIRNSLLADTDFHALSDVTMTSEMASYRQALRDLPSHANWPNLDEADWPTKP